MQVSVSEEMKTWVAQYIRENRKKDTISIHVVFSNFNKNFRKKFAIDTAVIVRLLIEEEFLKGNHTLLSSDTRVSKIYYKYRANADSKLVYMNSIPCHYLFPYVTNTSQGLRFA